MLFKTSDLSNEITAALIASKTLLPLKLFQIIQN
jgi:hypothetical protein